MKYIEKYWIAIVIVFLLFMFIKPVVCFLMLGSLIFYIGIKSILFLKRIQEKGITCTGKILSFQADRKGYKTPVVEFTPVEGGSIAEKPFIYASTDLNKIRSYKKMIDKEVLILYDPGDPKKFILADEKHFNYFVFVLLILAGLAFITLSICSLSGYIKIR
jgi:hypothetical protein